MGGNGSGKTVFLAQACLHGARFVTNTHTLLADGIMHAVPTSVRVRQDAIFGPLIAGKGLVPHMDEGDYLTSAETLFGDASQDSAPVRNLVVADFDRDAPAQFEEISPADAVAFAGQFSTALTVYGLKDDLLEHYGRDFHRFATGVRAADQRLSELARSVRCFRGQARRGFRPGPADLPGWTRAHVLTHLARHADALRRTTDAATRHELGDPYPGGAAGRAAEITAGAERDPEDIVSDLRASVEALSEVWRALPAPVWEHETRAVAGTRPLAAGLVARWVEVEVHHVDLDVGYRPRDLVRRVRAGRDALRPGRIAETGSRRRAPGR